jgi:antitoxin component YwqK of YwqJK toxin-antitoxin module
MIITLELLRKKKACEDGINYFKSLGKKEWEVMELVKKCIEDKTGYAGWLFETFQLTGLCETFHENGNVLFRGHYIDGRREGACEFFDTNGHLRRTDYHKAGRIVERVKS